jgi:DNA-directed RNA polymerase subunit L
MKFHLENTDVCYVNALRRIILAQIPNVAIVDDMTFIKNNTPLHNEFMSHRISLIPCCFEKEVIDEFDPSLYLCEIDIENTTNDIIDVTTKHIKIMNPQETVEEKKYYKSKFVKSVFPPSPVTKDYILISRIKPKEALHVQFRMAKDIAKSHAKWCPVSLCAHHFLIDDDEVKKAKDDVAPEKMNQFETIDKWRMYKKNEFGEPNYFELNIESECRMSEQDIMETAREILVDTLASVHTRMKVEPINESDNMYAVVIDREDHTIGNVIQATIFNNYIRDTKSVEYCGFFKPHPLENRIVVKIKFVKPISDVIDFFKSAMKKTIEDIPIPIPK